MEASLIPTPCPKEFRPPKVINSERKQRLVRRNMTRLNLLAGWGARYRICEVDLLFVFMI
jgi:hypothetical protein